jgi:quercetin dioxygenase-like cupin family protein
MTEALRIGPVQSLEVVSHTPAALELESTWQTGGSAPPRHWHPHQDEEFEVLEGELTVELGSAPARVIPAGGRLQVPARTQHRMWNADQAPARARWRISPAEQTLVMFQTLDRAEQADGRSRLATNLGRLGMLWRFRREFRIGPVR